MLSVKAAGVNFPDVLMIENKYQVKPPLPFSPGGEAAGVVSQVGAGVGGVKTGDRVMAITGHGAFAEKVVVSADRLVAIPAAMNDVTAGAFLFTYATSDHAVRDRGELKAGETLLVLGAAGGVGLAAVEIGKAVGATVIACASSDDKLEVCREHGADEMINYATEDLRDGIKQHYGRSRRRRRHRSCRRPILGAGVPIHHVERPLRRRRVRRRRNPENPAQPRAAQGQFHRRLIARRLDAARAGTLRRKHAATAAWYAEGRLKPRIDRTFPLERAAEAIAYMAGRR